MGWRRHVWLCCSLVSSSRGSAREESVCSLVVDKYDDGEELPPLEVVRRFQMMESGKDARCCARKGRWVQEGGS